MIKNHVLFISGISHFVQNTHFLSKNYILEMTVMTERKTIFRSSALGQNQDFFGMKIELFDSFPGEIYLSIFNFWCQISNISKIKVLSKLNFWTKISISNSVFFENTHGHNTPRSQRHKILHWFRIYLNIPP